VEILVFGEDCLVLMIVLLKVYDRKKILGSNFLKIFCWLTLFLVL